MFFVWFGGKCTQEQKLGRFPHKESAHTHFGLLSHVKKKREREGDEVHKTVRMHRARSKGIGRKYEHTSRETHLTRRKTKDVYLQKAAFMEAFAKRKKEEKKEMMEQLERKRTQSEVPTVHGSSSKPDERKVDLKTCVSEPGEEILVKSLKSKSGGVVGKMEYSGKAFPIEKRKKIMMARKAEIELVLEQKLEKELMMREEGVEEGDADEDEERVELPVFIGSMSKKKKKHNKKMARRAYTK